MTPPSKNYPVDATVEDRLWARVKIGDGCWEWQGGRDSSGYGIINVGGWHGNGRKSHRVSWALANGAIPAGLCVLHSCDNRLCVRPSHLSLGSNAENVRQRVARGRSVCMPQPGEKHGMSKLSERQVREILAASLPVADLAVKYGVSRAQIYNILARKRWGHL